MRCESPTELVEYGPAPHDRPTVGVLPGSADFREEKPPTKTETTEARTPGRAARTYLPDRENPGTEILAFVALLVLAFLAGGAWASAQTAEDGASADRIRGIEQPGGEGAASARTGDLPAARPHPRGIPRRIEPQRARRQRYGRAGGLSGVSEEAGSGSEPATRALQRGERT